jgi:CheY-like chemotaxis protein
LVLISEDQATEEGAVSRKRILIADDEAIIRDLFTTFLTDLGYETAHARNGREAMERVATFNPDLLIIELVMPEQEDIETIHKLRGVWTNLKILAISGAFDSMFLRAAQLVGATATLPKPIQLERLASLVQMLIGSNVTEKKRRQAGAASV